MDHCGGLSFKQAQTSADITPVLGAHAQIRDSLNLTLVDAYARAGFLSASYIRLDASSAGFLSANFTIRNIIVV